MIYDIIQQWKGSSFFVCWFVFFGYGKIYFKRTMHADLAMLAKLTTVLALKLAVSLANETSPAANQVH